MAVSRFLSWVSIVSDEGQEGGEVTVGNVIGGPKRRGQKILPTGRKKMELRYRSILRVTEEPVE